MLPNFAGKTNRYFKPTARAGSAPPAVAGFFRRPFWTENKGAESLAASRLASRTVSLAARLGSVAVQIASVARGSQAGADAEDGIWHARVPSR